MNTHTHRNMMSILLGTGLLGGALFAGTTAAAECTSLKLIAARNAGVSISDNVCKDEKKIAVGSQLEISPGSRLWIKSATDENGATSQVICQNRSANAVTVSIDSASLPWIKPQGLEGCGEWVSNKLSCERDGKRNSFFCALATSKPIVVASGPKPTTSFKMRSSMSLLKGRKVEEIIKDITSEVALCKSLYDVTDSTKVTWTVSKLGKVEELNLDNDNVELSACIESVLKPEKHEQSSKEMTYKHTF